MIIEAELVNWFLDNKRDLPWRNTKNPYYIWISEVILQQTRVNQALGYYQTFIKHFPDISSLANAKEDEILKLWQGLGYYSRARNLHFSAKYIVSELKGVFPSTYIDLLKLKGVGEYTAAAIASIAFGERVPVVDGNVYRVLARIFAEKTPINSGKGKNIFFNIASELIKSQKPELFNQAMMEFGALQCVPHKPDCSNCLLNSICSSYLLGTVSSFPVKIKQENKKMRYFSFIFIENQEFTYLVKRKKNDIWKGLFEFPLIESSDIDNFEIISQTKAWKDLFSNQEIRLLSFSETRIHQLTHQKIFAKFYHIVTAPEFEIHSSDSEIRKIEITNIIDYPVPQLIANYINENKNIFN